MTLTKSYIIGSVYKEYNLPKTKSAELVESCLEIIKKTLENGEDILIRGFGKFCVKDGNNRRGRNPQPGNDLMLGSKRIVTFKSSSVLVDKLNNK